MHDRSLPGRPPLRAVLLAAGDGGRLGPYTAALPKPLVPLLGRPIVDYTLEALVDAGASEIVVVAGYREAQLRAALAEGVAPGVAIRFVSNPRYHAGASLSLRAARQACGDEPFLLVMSDHLLSATLLQRLLSAPAGMTAPRRSFVAADFGAHAPEYAAEATRVAVAAGGRVTAIGKGLAPCDALDAGAFYFAPAAWDAVDAVPEDCELGAVCEELARRGELFAADVTGAPWYDVDTPEDLAEAETRLAAAARTRATRERATLVAR